MDIPLKGQCTLLVTLGILAGCRPAPSASPIRAAEPALQAGRPVVLYDVGHNNGGGPPEILAAIIRGIEESGYVVRRLDGPVFDRATLQGARLLMIRGAQAQTTRIYPDDWVAPTPPAFTPAEVDEIENWVRTGGGLFVVVDHMPISGASEELLARFGVEVSNGFAVLGERLSGREPEDVTRAGDIVFRRRDGTLKVHPIICGTSPETRIDSVTAYTGSAFRLPRGGQSLAQLPPGAISLLPSLTWEFDESTETVDVSGWSQAGVIAVASGRVAILGDAGMLFTNYPDDLQFTLNILQWLSGRLPADCSASGLTSVCC